MTAPVRFCLLVLVALLGTRVLTHTVTVHASPGMPCSCGHMPLVVVRCADGSGAEYTCQYDDELQRCTLSPPRCPSGFFPAAAAVAPPSDLPVLNCSKLECGPSVTLVIRTCPDGRHAHPLCAWLPGRQRCGYRDPDCRFPDPQLDVASVTDGQPCACLLPMHVRLCDNGVTVAPYCRYSERAGRCLSFEPPCPSAPFNGTARRGGLGSIQVNGFAARQVAANTADRRARSRAALCAALMALAGLLAL